MVTHFASREQVWELMEIFGKLSYQEECQCLEVPEWLEVMFNACTH